MNRTTLLFVCFLIVFTQGEVINWGGTWDVKTPPTDDYCYPLGSILTSQPVNKVSISWVWDNSQACKTAKLANIVFDTTMPTPEDGVIRIKFRYGGEDVEMTWTITGDEAVFAISNGASSTYLRRQPLINWPGNWDLVNQDYNSCNPDGTVVISQDAKYVTAAWVWADTKPCVDAALAGKAFSASVDIPSGNVVASVAGIFAVTQDQAVLANEKGAYATFVRRQELVNWVGTWDITDKKSTTACYPDQYITIIPSGESLTSSWVWEKSDGCKAAGIAGQSFTQTQPVPKGSAVFLEFTLGGAFFSGLFTASGDTSVFNSWAATSASFKRRSQMVNWGGVFDINTKDTDACYPDGSITIAETEKQIAISWTWAKTDACSKLLLSGKEFSKTVDTPTGNGVELDVSSEFFKVNGLLTLFLDGAVFSSTNGASSTYTRRQENVNFEGTWTIQTKSSDEACYPEKDITITQSSGNTVASWTWAASDACKKAGLDGKSFSQTESTPRGKSFFLDFVVGDARVSGLFTVNGENAVFASNNGASATFLRTNADEPGSWTGIIIAIVVIVLIAAGAGYYFYMRHKNKKLEGQNLDNSVSGTYNRA